MSLQAKFSFLAPVIRGNLIALRYQATASNGAVHSFSEQVTLPAPIQQSQTQTANALVALLAFAAGVSYYKAFVPTTVELPADCTQAHQDFLQRLIAGGLGEFAFVNQLPQALTPQIQRSGQPWNLRQAPGTRAARHTAENTATVGAALVAIGGGKDSIVSLAALQRAGVSVTGFAINPKPPMYNSAQAAGIELVSAQRQLDRQLLQLNAAGAPNGHVPVTAINSLIALLSALVLEIDAVVFSNEAGASYGNLTWQGFQVNHQWSKSSAFEQLLLENLPQQAPHYFSLLRPLNELRIARNFATLTQYHSVFTSCNRAFTLHASAEQSWCGDCPKCRFIFLMLAAFLPAQQLCAIFNGKNLFADAAQTEGFLELMGEAARVKPFECVGEPLECRVALTLARRNPEWATSALMQHPEIAQISATEQEITAVFALQQETTFYPQQLQECVNAI